MSRSNEAALARTPFLYYRHIKGTTRYSIDAYSRDSNWRILFEWEGDEVKNVELEYINVAQMGHGFGCAEAVYFGERLDSAQRKFLGELAVRKVYQQKTQERLAFLRRATEDDLINTPFLSYQPTNESGQYSIDAYGSDSKWKIVFEWKDGKAHQVQLVKTEEEENYENSAEING